MKVLKILKLQFNRNVTEKSVLHLVCSPQPVYSYLWNVYPPPGIRAGRCRHSLCASGVNILMGEDVYLKKSTGIQTDFSATKSSLPWTRLPGQNLKVLQFWFSWYKLKSWYSNFNPKIYQFTLYSLSLIYVLIFMLGHLLKQASKRWE